MTQVGLCPACLGRMRVDHDGLLCDCGKRIPLLGTPRVPYVQQETSVEAAGHQAASGKASSDESRVLEAIRTSYNGLTDDDIERKLKLRHQTASARRRGLVLKGLVIDSDRKRKTSSGYLATIWELRQ